MKRLVTICLLLLPLNLVAQVPGVEHVLVIGVDGMSPDGVQKARTPNLNALIDRGAYSMHARAVLPSSSSPNWASMIMGAGPEQHGVTSNDWRIDQFVLPSTAYAADGFFPTIFQLAHSEYPEAVIAAVYDWGGFGDLFSHKSVTHALNPKGPEATAAEAIRLFKSEKPLLTFVHLDHVDGAGHRAGHGSAEYYEAVERADRLVGELMTGLEAAGMRGSTLVIVTADHGGYNTGHGGQTLAEMEIPWIVAGPGVVPGMLSVPINTYDTAATVAFSLGLRQPEAWIARPVTSAFSTAKRTGDKYVPAPRIHTAGRLFVDEEPEIRVSVDGDFEIRYTTNGTEPTINSDRYMRPVRMKNAGVFRARAFASDGTPSATSSEIFRVISSGSPNGLTYTYYEKDGMTELPHFGSLTPLHSGRVFEVGLTGIRTREDQFAVALEGTIRIDTDGEYTFYLQSDDGARLYLNGEEVVDNDGSHGPQIRIGRSTLAAGRHPIRIDYFEDHGGSTLVLYYEGPGIERQVVPPTVLFPTASGSR